MICIKHFKENDLKRSGKNISLKKLAVPSIYVTDECVDHTDEQYEYRDNEATEIITEPEAVDSLQQEADVIETLQQQIQEEKKKNEKLQHEIDEKNEQIKHLSHDLKTFEMNSLARFAVTASQNTKVIYSLLWLLSMKFIYKIFQYQFIHLFTKTIKLTSFLLLNIVDKTPSGNFNLSCDGNS